jgi:hypothetical protein
MQKPLMIAAAGEAVTGLALLLVPSFVGWLLLGAELTAAGVAAARVAGIALVALAIACWPGPPAFAMLMYSGAVTVYLGYVGAVDGLTGILLWPAVVLHLALTSLLAWESTSRFRKQSTASDR